MMRKNLMKKIKNYWHEVMVFYAANYPYLAAMYRH